MKGMTKTGETLEEQLARMNKAIKRHEMDLKKLKPITLQAPAEDNKESDLLGIMCDII